MTLREAGYNHLIDEAELRRPLGEVGLPILLMSQVQMTGHEVLLDEHAPAIVRLLHRGAPLPSSMVAHLHDLFANTLLKPQPLTGGVSPALMLKMMSACVGQQVSPEYIAMLMQDLGFDEPPQVSWFAIGVCMRGVRVLVMGAGAAGLCAAIELKRTVLYFDVVEKNLDVGGAWFEDRYPGASVDAPNHLYPYSFEPGPSWTRFFVKQQELQAYFRDYVRRHSLDERNPRDYLGMLVPDYRGPNTNLGHGGSMILHLEIQVPDVMNCLKLMAEGGFRSLECRREVHGACNDKVDAAHERMVWTHTGVNNWYKNSAGRVTANSPWRIVDYWTMAREPNADDLLLA